MKQTIYNTSFKLRFKIKKIVRRYEDGFSILQVQGMKYDDYDGKTHSELVLTGHFNKIFIGDIFSAEVKFVENGRGFKAEVVGKCKSVLPRLHKDIAIFIRKRVGHISTSTVEEAISVCGPGLISVIIKNPEKLHGIKNLTIADIDNLHESLLGEKIFEDLLMFIQSVGLSTKFASEIYGKLGIESVATIKKNPYNLLYFTNLPFKDVDFIAKQLGAKYASKNRIDATIRAFLAYRSDKYGDLCTKTIDLLDGIEKYVVRNSAFTDDAEMLSLEKIIKQIPDLILREKIVRVTSVENGEVLFLSRHYKTENDIVKSLTEHLKATPAVSVDVSFAEKFIEKNEKITRLAKNQKEGIMNCVCNKISILTGGPGTGKTYVINLIIKCFRERNPETTFKLLAPTGNASERMSELTKMEASTIHSGIELMPNGSFVNGQGKMLTEDVIIIDEMSMVDGFVFSKLIQHISPTSTIILAGDHEQLPSVGPGLILRDLMKSGVIPVTVLDEVFRQAGKSQIVLNSKKLMRGIGTKGPDCMTMDKELNDFHFVNRDGFKACSDAIVELVYRHAWINKNDIRDLCVLSPVKKGEIGVFELNMAIQERVNPQRSGVGEYKPNDIDVLRVGDKVLNDSNDKGLGVMNGFVGIIDEISRSERGSIKIVVDFGKERIITYDDETVGYLSLAYVMTVHKSQGCEYEKIVIPMYEEYSRMLTRNLVNTAWTRAKKQVICVGQSKDIIDVIIRENIGVSRLSCLIERLRKIRK